jgi:hypothetical protein
MLAYLRINTQLDNYFNNAISSLIKLGKPIKMLYLKTYFKFSNYCLTRSYDKNKPINIVTSFKK